MKQLYWNYFDRFGRNHKIGLYHGHSGHLVIYCNDTIIAIDFHVRKTKSYAFFIGEELFNVSIKGEETVFQYDCQIDKKAPTHRNKERQKVAKEETQRIMWASCALVGLGLVFWIGQYF